MTPPERYAGEVVHYLRRLGKKQRSRIEAELAQELAEYPESESTAALEAAWLSLTLFAAWLAVALASAPLVSGPVTNFGDFSPLEATYPFADYHGVAFEDGKRGTLYFSLQSRGLVPLTLLDFRVFSPGAPIVQEGVSFRIAGELTGGPPAGRFVDLVVLGPGEIVYVAVDVVMTNCDENLGGATTAASQATVEFSYLGLPRSAEIEIPGIYTTVPEPCR